MRNARPDSDQEITNVSFGLVAASLASLSSISYSLLGNCWGTPRFPVRGYDNVARLLMLVGRELVSRKRKNQFMLQLRFVVLWPQLWVDESMIYRRRCVVQRGIQILSAERFLVGLWPWCTGAPSALQRGVEHHPIRADQSGRLIEKNSILTGLMLTSRCQMRMVEFIR